MSTSSTVNTLIISQPGSLITKQKRNVLLASSTMCDIDATPPNHNKTTCRYKKYAAPSSFTHMYSTYKEKVYVEYHHMPTYIPVNRHLIENPNIFFYFRIIELGIVTSF